MILWMKLQDIKFLKNKDCPMSIVLNQIIHDCSLYHRENVLKIVALPGIPQRWNQSVH